MSYIQKYPSRSVLVLTDFFFPDSNGGANRVAYYTSQGLAERGHRVRLVTRGIRPDHVRREVIDRIDVHRYDLPRKSGLNFLISGRRRIWNILEVPTDKDRFSPDLLIIHQPLAVAAVRHHPLVRDIPWVYAFHSPWGDEFVISRTDRDHGRAGQGCTVWLGKKIRELVEASVLRRCQTVLVLSAFMKERLKRLHGLNGRVVIVPGGVDIDSFRPAENCVQLRRELNLPPDGIILLTVRNLRRRMGLANLVKAVACLGGAAEKTHLFIAGKGELEGELTILAREMNVAHRTTFLGHVEENNLPKYYQAADLFVLPTEHLEGFGMSTLEALAAGTPVIGTPVGATPELLRQIGEEWLTRDTSSEALAAKIRDRIEWMTARPTDYQDIKAACRDLAVRAYAWPRIMERWQEVTTQVISRYERRTAQRHTLS
jgi:glycosyltransferase involved in cell wall biosynthesis